jgi:hypothetical protein
MMAFLTVAAWAETPADQAAVASVYAERAAAEISAGNIESAQSLLSAAIELDGSNADAQYLKGRLALQAQDWPLALKSLRAALASGKFAFIDPTDAKAEAIAVLTREGMYAEAATLFKSDPALRDRPESLLFAAEGQFFLGNLDAYRALLLDYLNRNPPLPLGSAFWFLHAKPDRLEAADQAVYSAIKARLALQANQDPELLVLAVPFTLSSEERRRLIQTYISRVPAKKQTRRALIEELRYGAAKDSDLVEDFFTNSQAQAGLDLRDLEAFLPLLGEGDARDACIARLKAYSGLITEDRSKDLIPDFFATYRDGECKKIEFDQNQDGVKELSAILEAGAPRLVTQALERRSAEYTYGAYPSLSQARITEADGSSKSYLFGALGWDYPLFTYRFPFMPAGLPAIRSFSLAGNAAPDETGFAFAAQEILEERQEAGKSVYVRSELSAGEPRYAERSVGGKLAEKTYYQGGMPERSLADLDIDGRFETERIYARLDAAPYFELKETRIDADGDGLPEYRETYGELTRREWDYNLDGAYDAAEETNAQGAVTSRYFSSALNGAYDVKLSFAEGVLIDVKRGSSHVKALREGDSPVIWIGSKPFSGKELTAKEGLARVRGKDILICLVNGLIYAEVIR